MAVSNIDIDAALAEAQEHYRASNPNSLAQYEAACDALPGGNTRSAIYAEPFPLTMVKGEGAHLWDADGHEYADFLSEFTAGLYGHSHPAIRKAIDAALVPQSKKRPGRKRAGPKPLGAKLKLASAGAGKKAAGARPARAAAQRKPARKAAGKSALHKKKSSRG